jgi:hypothetical protein
MQLYGEQLNGFRCRQEQSPICFDPSEDFHIMPQGFVYVLVSPNSNFIKIGGTERPIRARLCGIADDPRIGQRGRIQSPATAVYPKELGQTILPLSGIPLVFRARVVLLQACVTSIKG